MHLTRRDLLKASAALGGALALSAAGLPALRRILAREPTAGGLPVVWLQAQTCSGCSVSLLNSITLGPADKLLSETIDLEFHPVLMAAAGGQAVAEAERARTRAGYVLVVEGAVPTAENGEYCYLWPGTTALAGVRTFAQAASMVVAVGTCASYGGVAAGKPNVTGAAGLRSLGGLGKPIVNVPGCPAHPDWLVGTIATILKTGSPPALDAEGRPAEYYGKTVHDACPNLDNCKKVYGKRLAKKHNKSQTCFTCHDNNDARHIKGARRLTEEGCLLALGCKGILTGADCPTRKWNAGDPPAGGTNWCIGAGSPCLGCTQPAFPDGLSPFLTLCGPGAKD
ncbi:MAG: hydrogenase small subunit [Planctomycetes bacterium]|nr:hydrogenase small subunit [Planctomycetota bacterium]